MDDQTTIAILRAEIKSLLAKLREQGVDTSTWDSFDLDVFSVNDLRSILRSLRILARTPGGA